MRRLAGLRARSAKPAAEPTVPPWGLPSDEDLKLLDPAIPTRTIASHTSWGEFLCPRLDQKGLAVLEIGSRAVNSNGVFRNAFSQSDFTGFDVHPGLNVDIVGDAHRLSDYFEPKYFDGVVSSAVFEHLAFPWVVAEEISKVTKLGALVFVETHFSYSMHELPWNFFQFSDKGLQALFNRRLGFETIEAGVSNPLVGRFSQAADPYLVGQPVANLYCHAGYLGVKTAESEAEAGPLDWRQALSDVYENTEYPRHTSRFQS